MPETTVITCTNYGGSDPWATTDLVWQSVDVLPHGPATRSKLVWQEASGEFQPFRFIAYWKSGSTSTTSESVDIVLCDLMMPKMNGKEFLEKVRSNPDYSNVPVMMLTAVTSPDAEFQLLESGADDYCNKNVKRKILLKRVERLLARRKRGKKDGANPVEHLLR